jgi:hypothetical protein
LGGGRKKARREKPYEPSSVPGKIGPEVASLKNQTGAQDEFARSAQHHAAGGVVTDGELIRENGS